MLFDTNEFSLQTHCLIFGSDGCSHVSCWIVQLESSSEHFATSCNILQWSDGFEAWPNNVFTLPCCVAAAQLLQKEAREVTDPWDLQQGLAKIELFALFRLRSSCCLAYSALEQGKVQVFHAFDCARRWACQDVTFWFGFASAARLNSWDEAFLTQPLQANMWSGRFHRWHILVSSFKHVKCVAQYVVSGMIYNVTMC